MLQKIGNLSQTTYDMDATDMRKIRNAYIVREHLLGENLKSKANFAIGGVMDCGEVKIVLAKTPQVTRMEDAQKDYYLGQDCRLRIGEKLFFGEINILARNAVIIGVEILRLIILNRLPYFQSQDTTLTMD